jgi:hypothetical protein
MSDLICGCFVVREGVFAGGFGKYRCADVVFCGEFVVKCVVNVVSGHAVL